MNGANLDPAGIKVSVAMITYNHEAYIAQAIDSVLMQQTDFAVELVIGEDCSTDRTREIVRAYQERYPERIRSLLPERNQGMLPNFVATLQACRGQYIALLEGDDYWTNPLKLQKQVDFLENHPECAMCYHRAVNFHEDGSRHPTYFPLKIYKEIMDINDLLGGGNILPTASVVFINGLLPKYPEWFYKMPVGDWPLYVLIAQYGKIGYLDEVMSTHRSHEKGIWSGRTLVDNCHDLIAVCNLFDANLGTKYKRPISTGLLKGLFAFISSLCQPR